MALYRGSGERWETEIRIWVKPTLRGQAGGKMEPFPQEKPGNCGKPEFALFWSLLQGWFAEGTWLRDTRPKAHPNWGKKSLLSLGLHLQHFAEGQGCRTWRGAVMCCLCTADGVEGLGGNSGICLLCFSFCLLRSKGGKAPSQVGKVPPSTGASCRGTPVCLSSGFRKRVIFPWPNDQPFLCFPSPALQGLWSQVASLMCIHGVSQVASGKCRNSAGVEGPPLYPTLLPTVAEKAGKQGSVDPAAGSAEKPNHPLAWWWPLRGVYTSLRC